MAEQGNDFKYPGAELDLFAGVHHWKAYWAAQIRPFLQGDVLEVGAGIGANTPFFDYRGSGRWVCREPDPELFSMLEASLRQSKQDRAYETVCGTLRSLPGQLFDTIVYI